MLGYLEVHIIKLSLVLFLSVLLFSVKVGATITYEAFSIEQGEKTKEDLGIPVSVLEDDLLLVQVTIRRKGNNSITPPSGWTQIGGQVADGDVLQSLYYRIATSVDAGSSEEWKWTGKRRFILGMTVFRGIDTAAPVDMQNSQAGMSWTSITAPSVTTSIPNTMLVGVYSLDGGNISVSPGVGMTEIYDVEEGNSSSGVTAMVSFEPRAPAGATGDRVATSTWWYRNEGAIGHLVALKEAVFLSINSVVGSCTALNEVTVEFSEDVTLATAEDVNNYSLVNAASSSISITSAQLSPNNTVTLITATSLNDLTDYTLTVNNVESVSGSVIGSNSNEVFSLSCGLNCISDIFPGPGALSSEWSASSSNGSFGIPRIVENGRLRLTDASGQVATVATLLNQFPGAENRVEVEFDYYAYNGSGADGVAVTFSDADISPSPGSYGGALGYAQRSGGNNGFAGGWLGIGIDEYGNFSNANEGKLGGSGFARDSVALRGSGSGTTGYPFLTGTGTLSPGIDQGGSTPNPGHRYKIIIDHTMGGREAYITVERNTGSGYVEIIPRFDIYAVNPSQADVPTNWVVSFTGSTGGATNIHEIGDFGVCAAQPIGALKSLDHFDISLPVTGSTCAPSLVSINAIDNFGAIMTDYTGTVDISTSSNHGNWSKQIADGILNPTPDNDDNGAVQYTFVASDNGGITLNLENTHADALTVSVEDNAESVLSTSSKITFSDNAFVISENDALDYDVVAGRDHQFIASLWTKDSASGLCAVNANYHGLFDLKAWITNGVNDAGGAAPKLLDDVGGISMPASLPASNNITLDFSNGLALFNWRTTDVAQHTLSLLDNTSDFVVDELGNPLSISSSNIFSPWAVRPFGFYLEVIGNPKASDANGDKYIAAGQDFTVNVTAVRYDAGDDSNGDGHPDGHADSDPFNNSNLSDNLPAVSFGNENEAVDLSSLLILPTPLPSPGTGIDPGLSVTNPIDPSSFSLGVAAKTAQFNEVGIIEVTALLTAPGYLNNPATNVYGASGVVGRFYPASFDISFASLSPATFNKSCNSTFTYMDQPFLFLTPPDVTITAVNAHGDKTENYEKDFWKLGADLQEQSSCHGSGSIKGFCYTDNVLGDAILSAPDANQSYGVIDDVGGEVVFTLHDAATDEFIYGRPSTGLIAPFDADVQLNIELEDSDGVTGANALSNIGFSGDTDPAGGDQNIANDEFLRYGRWVLENAFGPETAPLKIPMSAQYYDGTTFVTNTDDSCSVYDSMGMQVDPSLKAGGTTTPLGSGTASSGFAPLADQIELSAPGVGHEGTANLCLTVDAWLKFDWNGDGLDLTQACDLTVSGEQNDNPTSTATFGRYRGHDRIIYWREVSN